MLAAAHRLWPRVDAFSLDHPDATMTFTSRLARDNGWSRVYARRVVEEYKRFMFLAVVAEHMVTPSEAVDQAWHLHLTYTRSYWGDFCGEVLGKQIHHDPTTGIAEQGKFVDLYERTRQSYEHWFGHPPPEAIWPAASVRFGDDAKCRWVNVNRNWVIRKPAFWSRFGKGRQAATLVGLAVAPPLVVAAQPIGQRGAETIFLIGGLVLAAVIIVSVIRGMLSKNNPREKNGKRTSYDTAAGSGIAGGAVGCGAGFHGHCHDDGGSDSGGDCGGNGCGSGCGGSGCGGGGCGGGCGGG